MGNAATNITLDKIRTDGGTQPRESIDSDLANEYREQMEEGAEFPPVEVVYDGEQYWPWDGFHRIEAARRADFKKIAARVRQGTQRDAIWLSFSANKTHGLRRDRGDITRALQSILHDDEWKKTPQSKIAEHVGCSAALVSQVKASIKDLIDRPTTQTVTRNGKTFEMNTANIGRKPEPVVTFGEVDEDEPQSDDGWSDADREKAGVLIADKEARREEGRQLIDNPLASIKFNHPEPQEWNGRTIPANVPPLDLDVSSAPAVLWARIVKDVQGAIAASTFADLPENKRRYYADRFKTFAEQLKEAV